jgi:protein-disulfide isomerase
MSNEAKVLIGISLATILIVVGAAFLVGGKSSSSQAEDAKPIDNVEALVHEDSHIQGPKNAKVTLVEFGDYQCPACGVAYPTVKQLQGEFGNNLRFVFRNFPLQMHPNAQTAAEAAEAAGAQGKYFEMHDMLYDNQSKWADEKNPLDIYKGYAKKLGLDVDKFAKAVQDKQFEKQIKKDSDDGYAVGVNSTPTFFINGVKQEGGLGYNDFKDKINQVLQKTSQ